MKQEVWAEKSIDVLHDNGYRKIKGHRFARLINGVFQAVSFHGRKKDIYVWRNALPLSLPDLWPPMGWKNAAGRLPVEEGKISLESEDAVGAVQTLLRDVFTERIMPIQDATSSLQGLHDTLDEEFLPYAAFPKAFCMFQRGELEVGRDHLRKVIEDPLRELQRPMLEELVSLADGDLRTAIGDLIEANIRKNRLSKLDRL